MLLLAIAVILIWVFHARSETMSVPALQPFDGILTEEPICSVTLSLTGVESEAALRLFASVCEGMNVRPCIFVTNEWLKKNEELLPKLSFAELGLLFEEAPNGRTKKKTMSALAEENESFLSWTGSFPRYVRIMSGEPNEFLSSALQAYGQICVSSRSTLSEAPVPGGVADCGLLNGTTGYSLAKYCAAALAEGYTVTPLSELQKYI